MRTDEEPVMYGLVEGLPSSIQRFSGMRNLNALDLLLLILVSLICSHLAPPKPSMVVPLSDVKVAGDYPRPEVRLQLVSIRKVAVAKEMQPNVATICHPAGWQRQVMVLGLGRGTSATLTIEATRPSLESTLSAEEESIIHQEIVLDYG